MFIFFPFLYTSESWEVSVARPRDVQRYVDRETHKLGIAWVASFHAWSFHLLTLGLTLYVGKGFKKLSNLPARPCITRGTLLDIWWNLKSTLLLIEYHAHGVYKKPALGPGPRARSRTSGRVNQTINQTAVYNSIKRLSKDIESNPASMHQTEYMDDLINTLREIGFQPIIFDEFTEQEVCMNPGIPTCDSCIFNGRTYHDGVTPWCKPEERKAKNGGKA